MLMELSVADVREVMAGSTRTVGREEEVELVKRHDAQQAHKHHVEVYLPVEPSRTGR